MGGTRSHQGPDPVIGSYYLIIVVVVVVDCLIVGWPDGSGVLQRYENLGGGVYALGVESPDNAGPSSGPITGSCVQMANRGIGDDGRGRIWGEGMDWIGGGLGYRVAAHASGAMRSDTRAATRLVSDWLLIPINSPRPPLISTHPEHFNAVFENSYSADFESAPEEGSVQLKIIRVKISSRYLEVGSWQELANAECLDDIAKLWIVRGLACLDMMMHNGPSYRKKNK
ncbi:hypothetical protein F2Q68_00039863 [Brassica cretica]|uniref:Uncharacterized protein n=1 Tax=Brassica cretica TaxID=69181 RepID=A0A8S9MMT6_BRACR|nr:hypothetical protein F2Q68_00039863 [Brassica cretica]